LTAPTAPLLRVTDLSVRFSTSAGVVEAVDRVTFEVQRGRTLAIVGESGSGKTVLTRAALGVLTDANTAVDGQVVFDGTDLLALAPRERAAVWGKRFGLISQNPMVALNPVVRVGRQMTESLRANLGLRSAAAEQRALELLDSVGVPDPRRRFREYPHQLSGGLRQRVTIAMAISCGPDLLVADEPTTALDVTVQAQILDLLQEIQREHGMALIFISHDLGVVAGLADDIAVMYAGRFAEQAPAVELFAAPRMPYTAGLLAATPRIGSTDELLYSIEGRPPNMLSPPGGCRFHPRCAEATDKCRSEAPVLEPAGPSHRFACWHPLNSGVAMTLETADGR
jgi:oligopeptide/dipeptide ABC transporter ATP-binding protein